MQQYGSKYFSADPTVHDPGGQKVNIQLFKYMVMVHIKLK